MIYTVRLAIPNSLVSIHTNRSELARDLNDNIFSLAREGFLAL